MNSKSLKPDMFKYDIYYIVLALILAQTLYVVYMQYVELILIEIWNVRKINRILSNVMDVPVLTGIVLNYKTFL